ncbi:glycoside hydrolase family 13 protein [Flagellimonas zhangzhouensis]|uniref:Oligo-1,6-glucosidase n=1 Tax=Flagellimonas zhangzhouensis TaxID=1073328 RepID=A0A1H2UC52_9FLAO|nr:alpha-glucosidase [Allomuricauda zhangzhouensis]SDQ18302.1 oligo-1,6-glucosidase [Allomuricauda zhangzhouensis]SDW53705.1 oligo-1,6-glucosidase [Allomuricauda zhangzhouensis]
MKRSTIRLAICLSFFVGTSCKQNQPQTANTLIENATWWKEAIVYQIYPRSFKDSDGDGIGDLKGIIEKLDYIKSLGVTAVWLNPIYTSPNADNGYDVSDYRDIMAEFGTMEDFDNMLEGMHQRDIKLVMDIVVNHSSDEHEWFKQSRSSRDNPYRNYYHWWPAEKGKPPYRYSLFDAKGDAWQYDSITDAFYLHYFAKQQPDLNWSNPKVRQEVYDIMKFWAEKGVDGFRLDAFQFAAKDTTYPKFPDGFEKDFIQYYAMQDGLHSYLKEMNEEVFSKYDVMSVAEGAGRNFEDAHNLVDADRKELNMAYAFEGVDIPKYEGYDLSTMKEIFTKWDQEFAKEGWLSIFLANHDQARMVSRWGNDDPKFRSASTKLLNTFMLSMRGTPYCYYGDELGMTNIDFDSISQYQDIAAINGYQKALSEGEDMELFMEKLNFSSRDNGRTPMQWNETENAGFTSGTPWLPVNENYIDINVDEENSNPKSVLNHFKKMAELRKQNPILIYGSYELVEPEHPTIYAYTRNLDGKLVLVLLNFSEEKSEITLDKKWGNHTVLINNYSGLDYIDKSIKLMPYQAVILNID